LKGRARLLAALLLAVGIALVLSFRGGVDAQTLKQWIDAAALAGPLVFIGLYVIATLLFLPGSLLTLAGGALFGPVWGTLINLTGATLGAALAYTWLGYAGREAAAGGEGLIQKGLIALALLAALTFLPRLIARLGKTNSTDNPTTEERP
jgi:uncharacterized membrane protein YdjX (TVP38/TMEM64 family)